jgi:hypothetical protein
MVSTRRWTVLGSEHLRIAKGGPQRLRAGRGRGGKDEHGSAIGYSFGKAVEAKECTPRQVRRGLMAGIEPLQMLFNVQAQSSSGGDR